MTSASRLLLLNPPGRACYVRDNYCSYTSKTGEVWLPQDLLFQSAWLGQDHTLRAVDAIAAHLSPARCLAEVARFSPRVVLALTGLVSLEEDLAFFAELCARRRVRLFLSGDLLRHAGRELLACCPFVEGILTDFTSSALARHLAGSPTDDGLLLRADRVSATSPLLGAPPPSNPLLEAPPSTAPLPGEPTSPRSSDPLSLPRPRHELFPLGRYRMALLGSRPVAATMSSFGCPFRCPFCIFSVVPYRPRPVAEVAAEVGWLTSVRGIDAIYFHDPLFPASRRRCQELCQALGALPRRFTWACNGHVATMDRPTIAAMASAGCRAVMLGLETASDENRAALGKRFSSEQALQVIRWCREAGIATLGYFLLGLPTEDEAQMRRTIAFARRSGVDYASFNLVAPPQGTAMHPASGPLAAVDHTYHSSLTHPLLSARQLGALRREAYRRFYLRPGYLVRQLAATSPAALLGTIARGVRLLGRQLRR